MNGEVADVQAQEHELQQLGQRVVPQLKVKDDGVAAPLERVHGLVDVLRLGGLAQDVQAVLLDGAAARLDLHGRRAAVLADLAALRGRAARQRHQDEGHRHERSQEPRGPPGHGRGAPGGAPPAAPLEGPPAPRLAPRHFLRPCLGPWRWNKGKEQLAKREQSALYRRLPETARATRGHAGPDPAREELHPGPAGRTAHRPWRSKPCEGR